MVADPSSPFLTVEEAGDMLRVGRTKAYAMAKEWRATGGRAGLPVVDLGHVLRVPRQAIEELLLGGPAPSLGHPPAERPWSSDEAPGPGPESPANLEEAAGGSQPGPAPEPSPAPPPPLTRRTRRGRPHCPDQLCLFDGLFDGTLPNF